VRGLTAKYATRSGAVTAVDNVNFSIEKGKIMGLAGESGCGKSSLALAMLKLLEPPNTVSGEVYVGGQEVIGLDGASLRDLRWRKASIVFQSAMNAFDPVHKVQSQMAEAIRAHTNISTRDLNRTMDDLLRAVRIDPKYKKAYPHELSGGMKQRVAIAMAMELRPQLLIADEPTTALDVVTQRQILILMKRLSREHGTSMLVISHDLSLLSEVCDEIMIMYGGRTIEIGGAEEVVRRPLHPYTGLLLESIPSLYEKRSSLRVIKGYPPSLASLPRGCHFHPRCPYATDECTVTPPAMTTLDGSHAAACYHPRVQ
jgi:oligopeptide/dipeptide ABC transporter ATP-binding protein